MKVCCKCGKIELTYQNSESGLTCFECSNSYLDSYVDNYKDYMLDWLIKNNLETALNIFLELEDAK